MGRFLNPGNKAFQKTLKSEIYVDKTMLWHTPIRLLALIWHAYAIADRGALESPSQRICLLLIIAGDVIPLICFPL